MMSYRYANSTEFAQGYWAALWVFAGAIGGRRYTGANDVLNSPRPPGVGASRGTLSLFAHHGDLDVAVPPGPTTNTTTLVKSTAMESDLINKGNVPSNEAGAIPQTYADSAGGMTSTRLRWARLPSPFYNNGNPEVIEYRDPTLGHTNYWEAGSTAYFDASFVWNWLMAHPRIL